MTEIVVTSDPTKVEEQQADPASLNESSASKSNDLGTQEPAVKHTWEFWLIMLTMCAASFLSALDTTIITTALPQITAEIGGGSQYVWIANSFLISNTVSQPLYGQLSNIFGRRNPYLVAMTLFILGAGIGGGAHNVGMLIAGRTIQGLGSGGCMLFGDLVVADIAPLRERAKYFSILLSTAAIGTIVGPIIGGALAQSSWRWCFYINLPLGFPCLVLMFFFLRLKYTKSATWAHSLARIDWIGTLIFIPSVTAFAFGLIAGGQMYPWSSFRTILPIVLGGAGWICYHFYEASPFCKEPGLPPRVFKNRTSLAGYVLTFLGGLLLNWVCYFMPFYFQAVWGATPVLAGVYLLPLLTFMIPAGGVSGGIMSKTGQYKPLHWVAFGMTSLGVGLFSILNSTSNAAEWVFFQIFTAIGLGFALTSILPAINAGLEEKDVAAATAVFSFLKTLDFIWGVTIPSIIFNNQFDAHSTQISDESLRDRLKGGHAYSYAVSGYGRDITGQLRDEVVGVYTEAIKTVWYVAVAFALLGFLVVFVEKHIELRTELTTEYGIEERKVKAAMPDAEKAEDLPK